MGGQEDRLYNLWLESRGGQGMRRGLAARKVCSWDQCGLFSFFSFSFSFSEVLVMYQGMRSGNYWWRGPHMEAGASGLVVIQEADLK